MGYFILGYLIGSDSGQSHQSSPEYDMAMMQFAIGYNILCFTVLFPLFALWIRRRERKQRERMEELSKAFPHLDFIRC